MLSNVVNEIKTDAELESIRQCVVRGRPFGTEDWVDQTTKALGLESTIRSRGRPRNAET